MAYTVTRQDPRYPVLKRSRNNRWPASEADAAGQIEICSTVEEAAAALQRVVKAGLRPTIRSGGHCYEDFVVNNPGGAILDLSLLTAPPANRPAAGHWIPAGKALGDLYLDLYKRAAVALPAGTCYTVGAGGHISGGGYGLLARLHGLTVDWVSAVDILTVNANGKVIPRRVDAKHDPDLFRALRGAGGGNYGVITGFHCDKLPAAPTEVITVSLNFEWANMTEERFVRFLTTYGEYWATRGTQPDTWGLFAILVLSHVSARTFGMTVQFCNPDGTCRDLSVLHDFLDRFLPCKPVPAFPVTPAERNVPVPNPNAPPCAPGQYTMQRRHWLDATVGRGGGGGGGTQRAKYKSSYMKRNFTADEARIFYKHLHRTIPGADLRGSLVAVDSYGGAANHSRFAKETALWQRSSIMKLQFQSYWMRKEDDAARLQWMRDFFTEAYAPPRVDAAHAGTPYLGDHYEGCYMNYPTWTCWRTSSGPSSSTATVIFIRYCRT